METTFFRSFPKKFAFVSLCSFICLKSVYQLRGPVCKATWSGCPSYSASHLHFMFYDFGHVLYTKMLQIA